MLGICIVLSFATGGAIRFQGSKSTYPQTDWQVVNSEEAGWSKAKLEDAHQFFATLPEASAIVVDQGRVIAQWGDPALRIKVSSIRKSLLSAQFS